MDEKKFLKLKKEYEAKLKEGTVEDLIISLHENFSTYREINFEIQKLYAEKTKNQQKIQEIKASENLSNKDLSKIEAINKSIASLDAEISKKEESYKIKEPEFVVAQELIGKLFKLTFRVSEITSVIALSVRLRQVDVDFLSTTVKKALSYKNKIAY